MSLPPSLFRLEAISLPAGREKDWVNAYVANP
jgi:hypothetical protein